MTYIFAFTKLILTDNFAHNYFYVFQSIVSFGLVALLPPLGLELPLQPPQLGLVLALHHAHLLLHLGQPPPRGVEGGALIQQSGCQFNREIWGCKIGLINHLGFEQSCQR